MFERAQEAIDLDDLGPAIEQFEYLVNRLLSLSPTLRERKPQLRQILAQSAIRWLSILRWDGRNEEALALLPRFRESLPDWSDIWDLEEALNRIDAGEVDKGLDVLRAFHMQNTESQFYSTVVLARELFGAGLYDEAETLARSALSAADDPKDEVEAALLLVHIATEQNNRDAIETHWNLAVSKTDEPPYMYPLFERLSALGHWEHLEKLLKQEKNTWVRRLFQGEIARSRGDEAEARAQWQAIVDAGEGMEDESGLYARLCALLLTEQPEDVHDLISQDYRTNPNDTALIFLVASLAQLGRLEEAEDALRHRLKHSRFMRPKWEKLPPSYWLRLQRFPMPEEARKALKPYFVQPGG